MADQERVWYGRHRGETKLDIFSNCDGSLALSFKYHHRGCCGHLRSGAEPAVVSRMRFVTLHVLSHYSSDTLSLIFDLIGGVIYTL